MSLYMFQISQPTSLFPAPLQAMCRDRVINEWRHGAIATRFGDCSFAWVIKAY